MYLSILIIIVVYSFFRTQMVTHEWMKFSLTSLVLHCYLLLHNLVHVSCGKVLKMLIARTLLLSSNEIHSIFSIISISSPDIISSDQNSILVNGKRQMPSFSIPFPAHSFFSLLQELLSKWDDKSEAHKNGFSRWIRNFFDITRIGIKNSRMIWNSINMFIFFAFNACVRSLRGNVWV